MIRALPALLPSEDLRKGMVLLAREVMLGGVIGISGGWAAAWIAISLGL